MTVLSPELCAWIVPGLAGTIATVTQSLQPQMARVWAARALPALDVIEVYSLRSHVLALLEGHTNGRRIALSLIDVATYRSRMFKGTYDVSRGQHNAAVLEESLAAFNRVVSALGMATDTAERILAHDDAPRLLVPLQITVESVFDQSPKPGAGALM
jgi:hypothetical protein